MTPGAALRWRCQLARAWGVAPAQLRDATLAEVVAMTDVLADETRAHEQAMAKVRR